MDEDSDNLHWHALNYRTAASQRAEAMWLELAACVDRKIAAERERCAKLCDAAEDKTTSTHEAEVCRKLAYLIRA